MPRRAKKIVVPPKHYNYFCPLCHRSTKAMKGISAPYDPKWKEEMKKVFPPSYDFSIVTGEIFKCPCGAKLTWFDLERVEKIEERELTEEEMNDYWIKIEADEEVIKKMGKTLKHCQDINQWAINAFKKFWLQQQLIPYMNGISKNVTEYISLNKIYSTQRFTLNKTVEQTLRDFKAALISSERSIEYQISATQSINEFKIPPRKIWIRYIEDSGYISTYYGPLYLTGPWLGIIGNQLSKAGVTYGMLPYLWHSVSIKKEENEEKTEWYIRINFHDLTSYQGKRGRKEYRKVVAREGR